MNALNLVGQKYGRLTVLDRADNVKGRVAWKCECDCGNQVTVLSYSLRTGNTKSCGCLVSEKITKHGMHKTKLYRAWNNMISRCYCESFRSFRNYGGRGITVCDEWRNSFPVFADWAMNNGYREDLTIDRIDNEGNYEPSNCRWITNEAQQLNKRSNRRISFNGETRTIKEWSVITGIHPRTLSARLDHGWTAEDTLTKAVQR